VLSEVLDRPVAAVRTPRLPAGHAVRADRTSLKPAFVTTHVRRGVAAWGVQGGLEFGSDLYVEKEAVREFEALTQYVRRSSITQEVALDHAIDSPSSPCRP
jgi:hypothetical protein